MPSMRRFFVESYSGTIVVLKLRVRSFLEVLGKKRRRNKKEKRHFARNDFVIYLNRKYPWQGVKDDA